MASICTCNLIQFLKSSRFHLLFNAKYLDDDATIAEENHKSCFGPILSFQLSKDITKCKLVYLFANQSSNTFCVSFSLEKIV